MQLRGLSVRIGKIQVVIDYSWLIVFFFVVYSLAYFARPQLHLDTPQYWVMAFIATLLLCGSVLLHELAHYFVALRHGIRIQTIRLFVFGGLPSVSSEPTTGRHEFLIALAGPVTSMALAFFFGMVYGFFFLAGRLTAVSAVVGYLALGNMLLAISNLIPGFPLDGGRILRAILWDRWNDAARATKVVSQIGNGFALFLIVLGALQFLVTQSIIVGLWFIFTGLFMKQSALGTYHAVVLKQALAGIQIRQIMTREVVTVDWLTSLEDLIRNYFFKHQFTNFPVFNRDEMVGMVSISEVKGVSKELWPFKQVRDVMTPIEMVPSLKPGDEAIEALARMVSDDLGRMPVMDEGHLVGIVSRRDIMNLFKIKSDLGLA